METKRRLCRDLALVLFGLILGIGHTAHSQESNTRFELLGGQCKHHLGPDSNWHYGYGGYETNVNLKPNCGQVGLSTIPFEKAGWKWGFRGAFVTLGPTDTEITYPVCETCYFTAKATGTAVEGETARLQATGRARGLTLGLATEKKFGPIHVGPEAGIAALYTEWHTQYNHAQAVADGCRTADWACADGLKFNPYVGVTARYKWVEVGVRAYFNVRASQAQENPQFVGGTDGNVYAFLAGVSIPDSEIKKFTRSLFGSLI